MNSYQKKQQRFQKEKENIVIMSGDPSQNPDNLDAIDFIEREKIKNALILTNVMMINKEFHFPLKAVVFISDGMKEQIARKSLTLWWKMKENQGPKLAVWIPLNDLKEMTISSNLKNKDIETEAFVNLLTILKLDELYKKEMSKMLSTSPVHYNAVKNLGFEPEQMIIRN